MRGFIPLQRYQEVVLQLALTKVFCIRSAEFPPLQELIGKESNLWQSLLMFSMPKAWERALSASWICFCLLLSKGG